MPITPVKMKGKKRGRLDEEEVPDEEPGQWMYAFRLLVGCKQAGAVSSAPTALQDGHALWAIAGGDSAQHLLPGIPPCDLRAEPTSTSALANRIGVLGRATTCIYAAVAVFYDPTSLGVPMPGSQGGASEGTAATQADWGEHLLQSCVYVLCDTHMDPDATGQDGQAHAHGP
jgi:hypothetical protein